jgi:hypothetical protein
MKEWVTHLVKTTLWLMLSAVICVVCLQEMEDYGSTLSIYEHELLILRQATQNICRIEERLI